MIPKGANVRLSLNVVFGAVYGDTCQIRIKTMTYTENCTKMHKIDFASWVPLIVIFSVEYVNF